MRRRVGHPPKDWREAELVEEQEAPSSYSSLWMPSFLQKLSDDKSQVTQNVQVKMLQGGIQLSVPKACCVCRTDTELSKKTEQ